VSTFYRKGDRFIVRTEGAAGELEDFDVHWRQDCLDRDGLRTRHVNSDHRSTRVGAHDTFDEPVQIGMALRCIDW